MDGITALALWFCLLPADGLKTVDQLPPMSWSRPTPTNKDYDALQDAGVITPMLLHGYIQPTLTYMGRKKYCSEPVS